MTLWNKFLAYYFDGQGHTMRPGDVTQVTFPLATIVHQRANHAKSGLFIHLVAVKMGKPRMLHKTATVRRCHSKVTWTFFVKSLVTTEQNGHNSESLCRLAADRLFLLLSDPVQIKPLALNGVLSVRPSFPEIVTSDDWATRSMEVKALISFDIAA